MRFQWLRLWRNKLLLLVLAVSFSLSAFVSMEAGETRGEASKQFDVIWNNNELGSLVLLPAGGYSSGQLDTPAQTKAKEVLASFMIRVDIPGETESYGLTPNPTLAYLDQLQGILDEYQLPLRPMEKALMAHSRTVAAYMEHRKTDFQTFAQEKAGVFEIFVSHTDVFFGLIPLLMLFFLSILLYAENRQHGREVLLWTQPQPHARIIFDHFLSLLGVGIVYLLLVGFFLTLFCLFQGRPMGAWDFPLLRLSEANSVLPVWLFLIQGAVLFLSKAAAMILLGIGLGHVLRTSYRSMVGGILLCLLAWQALFFFPALRTALYPLNAQWEAFLLGMERHETLSELLIYIPGRKPEIPQIMPHGLWWFLGIYGLFAAVMLFASFHLPMWMAKSAPHREQRFHSWPFEWKKWGGKLPWKEALVGAIFLLSIFWISAWSFDNLRRDQDLKRTVHREALADDFRITQINLEEDNRQLNEAKKRGDDAKIKDYEEALEERQAEIKRYQEEEAVLNRSFEAYHQKNSEKYYGALYDLYRLTDLEPRLRNERQLQMFLVEGKLSPATQVMNEAYFRRLQQGAKPIAMPVGRRFTQYDAFRSSAPLSKEDSLRMLQLQDRSPWIQLYRLHHDYALFPSLLLLLVLLFGGNYAMEREHGNSLRWLYTLPLSRRRIYWEKALYGFLRGIAFLGLVYGLVFLFGIGESWRGTWDFPLLRYERLINPWNVAEAQSSHFSFVGAGPMALQLLGGTLLLFFFYYGILQGVSVFIRNRWLCAGLVGVLTVASLQLLAAAPELSGWNPAFYLFWPKILTGEILFLYPVSLPAGWQMVLVLAGGGGLGLLLGDVAVQIKRQAE